MYDALHDKEQAKVLTTETDTETAVSRTTYKIPRSVDELAPAGCHYSLAAISYGWMYRSGLKASFQVTLGANPDYRENIMTMPSACIRKSRKNLFLNHTGINPVDRHLPPDEVSDVLHVEKER